MMKMNNSLERLRKIIDNRLEKLEKIKEKGLDIIKLHEMLEAAGIDHEFKKYNSHFIIDYQILIKNEKYKISMVQSDVSYGIINNEIEIFDFNNEPVTSTAEHIFNLLKDNNLDLLEKYIILQNRQNEESLNEILDEFRKNQNLS